ncbi:TolC family protein, partial [Novosphingobium sp. 1949]
AAARAARTVAGLRPNPTLETQVENLAGSGAYRGFDSAEMTLSLALPIERGGKRSARIALADAQIGRAALLAAIARADIRLEITRLYVGAVAAQRRLDTAREQA